MIWSKEIFITPKGSFLGQLLTKERGVSRTTNKNKAEEKHPGEDCSWSLIIPFRCKKLFWLSFPVLEVVKSDYTTIVGTQGWPNNNNRNVNLIFFVTSTKYFTQKYIENIFQKCELLFTYDVRKINFLRKFPGT